MSPYGSGSAQDAMIMAGRGGQRPDYGLDAPVIIYGYTACAAAGLVLIVLGAALDAGVLFGFGVCSTVIGLGIAGPMVYSSRAGKIRVRERVLDGLGLRGDEDVLDLGCGSGLMLLGAAERLTSGTATGVDLWRSRDQAGSGRQRCLANARRLGVESRVSLKDADMAELPFPDASFDVVLACLAVHNLHPKSRREQAINEAVRVIRPDGRLALVDIAGTKGYARTAAAAGLADVSRSGFLAGIWPPARLVTATRMERR